ncbi:MAG: hypothetical protein IJL35_00765 [Bacteroidaceae bacterium]|nr:hypothetical protein [Bacteroidaceae bacterium]
METTVWLGLNFGAWIAIVTILCMFLTLDFTKLLGIFDGLDYVDFEFDLSSLNYRIEYENNAL